MPWIRSTAHASSRRNTTVVGMVRLLRKLWRRKDWEIFSRNRRKKKFNLRNKKKSRHYEENMGLYKLAEWFEQNIKNRNELNHWNCLTAKQFQFTKTYRNSIRCENLVTKRIWDFINKQNGSNRTLKT